MEKQTLSDFIDSYPEVLKIVDKKGLISSITEKELPLEIDQNINQFYDIDLQDLPEIEEELYRAFLQEEFSSGLIKMFDSDLELLRKYNSSIKNINQFFKSLKSNLKSNKSRNSNNFWERFYELNIIAFFGKNYRLLGIEEEAYQGNTNKTPDFHIAFSKNEAFIEIVTLSESGDYRLRRSGERKLQEHFKNKYKRPSFDLFPTSNFSYSNNQIRQIINYLEESTDKILQGGFINCAIDDQYGNKIVDLRIQYDDNFEGLRITQINTDQYLKIDNYIRNVKEKTVEKKDAFHQNKLNFLLVNIATQHPLGWLYALWDKSSVKSKCLVKKGQISSSRYNKIKDFEDKLSKINIDGIYAGIILHRYLDMDYNKHSLKIFLNPNRNNNIEIHKEILSKLELGNCTGS